MDYIYRKAASFFPSYYDEEANVALSPKYQSPQRHDSLDQSSNEHQAGSAGNARPQYHDYHGMGAVENGDIFGLDQSSAMSQEFMRYREDTKPGRNAFDLTRPTSFDHANELYQPLLVLQHQSNQPHRYPQDTWKWEQASQGVYTRKTSWNGTPNTESGCSPDASPLPHEIRKEEGGDDASMAVTNHPYRHTSVDSSSALTKRPDEDGHLEPVTARTSYTSTQTRPSLDQNVKADSASHSSSNSSYPQQSANGVRQADPINNDSPRLGATTTIAHAPPVSPHSDQDRVWISTRNTIPDPKILLSRSAVSQTPAATMMLATQEISDYHGTRPSNGSTVTNDVLPTDDGSSIGNRGVAGDSEHPSAPPELAATPSSPEEPARRSNFQSYLSGMVDSRRGSLKEKMGKVMHHQGWEQEGHDLRLQGRQKIADYRRAKSKTRP